MATHETLYSAALGREVSLCVHVPDGGGRFPVLYLYDGGAAFRPDGFNFEAIAGTLPPLILVGVEPPAGRWARTMEFAPYTKAFDTRGADFEPLVRGRGDALLDFVVYELKPWVDRRFPTLPEPEHTALGGMSSGALNTMYALMTRGGVFTRALLHGPAFNLWLPELLETARHADFSRLKYVYMDIGDAEDTRMTDRADALRAALRLRDEVRSRGVDEDRFRFRVIPGGTHSPAVWRNTFPDAVRWIFQDYGGLS